LTPQAAAGVFSYNTAAGVQNVNLLGIAAANGQIATIDPTVGKILGSIQASTATTGGVTPLNNPLVQQYTWSMPTKAFNPSPTMRLDYEVTRNHRLTGSFNYRHINSTPDTTNSAQLPFPNSLTTGSQQSTRWTTSESVRSTFGQSVFNEFRIGGSGGATLFSPELGPDMWSDTNGYRLNFNGACCGTGALLQNPSLGSGQSSREASTKVLENTTTWLKGNHNIQFGGTMVQADVWLQNQTLVPTAEFDIISGEAADAIFNATSIPGASAADITQAKRLYAMLTGRLSRLTGDARINAEGDKYNLLGLSRAEGRMREFNVFASDSWRVSPSLTVSAGVRYILANPFYPTNNSYTTLSTAALYGVSGEGNINMPGTLTGARPQFVRYAEGEYAYNPDRNNIAPSAGLAWQVPPSTGVMKWLRGSEDGDVVVRGGWAMAFQRPGMSDFTGVFGDNQGIQATLQATRPPTHCRSCCATTRRYRPPRLFRCRRRRRRSPPVATPSIRTSRCPTRSRGRPAGSARSRTIPRSSSATSAVSTPMTGIRSTSTSRISPPTASSTSSARRRPTCRRTSPPAAAPRSPTWAPAPARTRCRSSWRTSTRRTPPMPATPRSTRVRNGPTRRTSVSWPRAIRIRGASHRR
jgi:hypothetical protein